MVKAKTNSKPNKLQRERCIRMQSTSDRGTPLTFSLKFLQISLQSKQISFWDALQIC